MTLRAILGVVFARIEPTRVDALRALLETK
jgi:hypothetical protein